MHLHEPNQQQVNKSFILLQQIIKLKILCFTSLHWLGLIEQVNSRKPHHWSIRLVVLNVCLFELIFARILPHWLSRFLDEFVRHPLWDLYAVVGFVWKHFPFEYRFLRVELYAVKRVSAGLPNCHEFLVVWWCCLRCYFPKIAQLLVCVVCAHQNCLLVIVVSHSLASCQLADQLVRQAFKNVSFVASKELYAVDNRLLSSDWWQWSNAVASQVPKQLMAHASTPNWEHFSLIIFLHCPLEDKVGIWSPSIFNIKIKVSTWKKDTVEFRQLGSDDWLIAVCKDWNDLCAWHFDELDVRGRDEGLENIVRVASWRIVLVDLGVNTDDWALIGQGEGW